MDWWQDKMANFKHIATTTLSSNGSTTIEMANIPATYQDLRIYISARDYNSGNGTGTDIAITSPTFNAGQSFYGYSTIIGADTGANRIGGIVLSANEANNFGAAFDEILNYSSSIADKNGIFQNGIASSGYLVTVLCHGVNNSATPISSITILAGVGNFQTGTTVALYGITK
jgi:hypothetical protein